MDQNSCNHCPHYGDGPCCYCGFGYQVCTLAYQPPTIHRGVSMTVPFADTIQPQIPSEPQPFYEIAVECTFQELMDLECYLNSKCITYYLEPKSRFNSLEELEAACARTTGPVEIQ